MKLLTRQTVLIVSLLAVAVAIPVGWAQATKQDEATRVVADPEAVEQRDQQLPPGEVGSEILTPIAPIPTGEGIPPIGPDVDPDNPPAMETAVPVPGDGVEGLSAQANSDPVIAGPEDVAFRARFNGFYRFDDEQFNVVVYEPSPKAKARKLVLGGKAKQQGPKKVYSNSPAGGLVVYEKGAVVAVFGGRSEEQRGRFLDNVSLK